MKAQTDPKPLIDAVKAGRVANTGFLDSNETAQLVPLLRQADVSVNVSGGYVGSKRRVITVFPENIPHADTPLVALYTENVVEEMALRAALKQHLELNDIGDIIQHQEGLSIILLSKARALLPDSFRVASQEIVFDEIPLERLSSGSQKRQLVIVPSLRVDALGAKAFNVSRSYFSKGIKAGNVTINGKAATKSSSAEPGDEIYAQTIGRMYVSSVQGETRKGNLKVLVDIEKG